MICVEFISEQVKFRGTMVKKPPKPRYFNGRFDAEDPKSTLKIENVVASTGIDQELNLEALAADLPGTEYDPDRFPGLVYRLQEPKAACLIFRSGKIVSTGAQSIADVHAAVELTFETLRGLGIDVPGSPEIKVQNIVTSGDLGHPLNLNAIAISFGLENIEYEPEQFPGLVYRLKDPKVVVLLFGSGKVVITGGKFPENAEEAIDKIVSKLTEYALLGKKTVY
jgi:transcription initiation factor TFIID TATA-box-binding protein